MVTRPIFLLCFLIGLLGNVENCYIITVGYIPTDLSPLGSMTSACLQVLKVKPEDYRGFPSTAPAARFSVAVGDFFDDFALNMTGKGIPYLILGNLPSRRLTPTGWFRLAPEMVNLAPVVQKLSQLYFRSSLRLFIGDRSSDCLSILDQTQSDLDWNILTGESATVPEIAAQIQKLSSALAAASSIQLTVCSSSKTCNTHDNIFNASLQAGIFIGSVVFAYVPPNANMTPLYRYKDAGAEIFLLSPDSRLSPNEKAKRYLEAVAQNLTGPGDLMSLFYQETVSIVGPDDKPTPMCFQRNGFPCKIAAYGHLLSNGNESEISAIYDVQTGELDTVSFLKQTQVLAIAFQNYFLPDPDDSNFSTSSIMMKAIFGSSQIYNFKYHPIKEPSNGALEAQFLHDLTAFNYTISAFPLAKLTNVPANLEQTSPVLLDSVVIVGKFFSTSYSPFQIFEPFDAYVWLLILITLIVITVIFIAIQELYEQHQRNLGIQDTGEEVSTFAKIGDAIFHNFSALLLAKLILKPKMPSIRVLYQSYWLSAILLVVSFAAMLSAQRLVTHTTDVYFNSLTDLLTNTQGYRWFFLQNSSVYWLARSSDGGVLGNLYNAASTSWPDQMLVNSVDALSQRVQADSTWVGVLSNFEAAYLLKTQCYLKKLSPVQNLFNLAFYVHGPPEFTSFVQQKVDGLNSNGFFADINNQLTATGQCPQVDEKSELRADPLTLKDMSGLFIVLLAGLVIALVVEAIEVVRDKYQLYRQRAQNKLEFGHEYEAQVVEVEDNGVWIRLLDTNESFFVESARIHSKTNRQGKKVLEFGSYVKANYLGNDPITAQRIFTVSEGNKLQAVPLTPISTPQPG